MGYIVIDGERCKDCQLCMHACPHQLIMPGQHLNRQGYRPPRMDETRQDECTACALCAWMCPDVAILVYRSQPPEFTRGASVEP